MILRGPGGQHVVGVLIGTTYVPSVSDKVPLAEGNWLDKFLRNAGICLIARIWGHEISFVPDINDQNMNNYIVNIETFYSVVLEVDFFFSAVN